VQTTGGDYFKHCWQPHNVQCALHFNLGFLNHFQHSSYQKYIPTRCYLWIMWLTGSESVTTYWQFSQLVHELCEMQCRECFSHVSFFCHVLNKYSSLWVMSSICGFMKGQHNFEKLMMSCCKLFTLSELLT